MPEVLCRECVRLRCYLQADVKRQISRAKKLSADSQVNSQLYYYMTHVCEAWYIIRADVITILIFIWEQEFHLQGDFIFYHCHISGY